MFTDLGLVPAILEALRADGYERPTPIQAQSIPPALAKRDVLGIAQTGTGKTAAFALPIIQRLVTELRPGVKLPVGRKPKALVLAPTRELAAQIAESFASYGRHTPVRFAVIFGGVGQGPQVRAIQQGIDILVATPGRLIDLLQQRLVNLSEISFFVLDEADRMLDMGFIEPIRKISALLPRDRQTMLYSATMPKEIRHLADSLLRDPVTVTVTPVSSAVDRIDQKLYFVLKAQKTQLMIHLFETLGMERAVVFTKTKHGADRLARKLKAAGIGSEAIHGNKAQNQRIRALDAFRSGRSPVLVATDVAARGLDIDDVTHVVNYDLPMEPEAYVHRIGRTARAGKSGHAISFCDVEERGLLKQVERLIKFEIPRERVPDEVPKTDEAGAKTLGVKALLEVSPARETGRETGRET
ncbi:MAG: DEAD/DEAH box helicase, partial [Limnohabitans sp.]|nr:DEAD/DEAH box helicase [Limnohabitans sp.]